MSTKRLDIIKFNEKVTESIPSLRPSLNVSFGMEDGSTIYSAINPEIITKVAQLGWVILGIMGEGGSSTAFLVRNFRKTVKSKKYYAVLIINNQKGQNYYSFIHKEQQRGNFEYFVEIYNHFQHDGKLSISYVENDDITGPYDIIIEEIITTLTHLVYEDSWLYNKLNYILTSLWNLEISYTDIKNANMGIDYKGNLKLIDLESVRPRDLRSPVYKVIDQFLFTPPEDRE